MISRPHRVLGRASLPVLLGMFLPCVSAAQDSLQPPGWDRGIKGSEAVDLHPDARIVEINLDARPTRVEIAPGQELDAWTYNGSLPGPLIRLRVGDRLIVHFSNHLPQATTVHWHGLRVPVSMDGVPGVSQPEVRPGGSFTYDFVVPDAGLFWYHPHVMSAAQVGFGLYGALLVDDPTEPVNVLDELVLVFSDIEITKEGALESPDTGGPAGMLFGREGNHVLVNGRKHRRLIARAGVPQRWRIVNAAKSRYFNLSLDEATLVKIGGDGGLQEYAEEVQELVVAPGERLDVIVTPRAAPGTELLFQSKLYNRGYGSVETRVPFEDLFAVAMADLPPVVAEPLKPWHRAIEPMRTAGATVVGLTITVEKLTDGAFEYRVNDTPFGKDKPLRALPGETQIWTVTNKTQWSHPFHLHGFFFQVLGDEDHPVRPLAWKDTVDVPFKETRRFIVRFDDRVGSWMFHCHVLDHADGGLMGTVLLGTGVVENPHGHLRRGDQP